MASERLQKIMAASGIASRRKAEQIIAAGRVTLNGKVVTEQGTKADPERDEICVDGKPLKRPERLRYFLLNKPKGYVTTGSDPGGRPAVVGLLAGGVRANPWYEVTLMEGRNRQIRRMFEQVGHHVEKIKRVQLGPLVLDVEPGKFRELTKREVEELKKAAGEE